MYKNNFMYSALKTEKRVWNNVFKYYRYSDMQTNDIGTDVCQNVCLSSVISRC